MLRNGKFEFDVIQVSVLGAMDRYVDSVKEVSWSDEQIQLWQRRLSVPDRCGKPKPMGLFVHEYADGSELRLGSREAVRIHPDGTQVVDACGSPVELEFPDCLRKPRLLICELQDDHRRAGCSDAGAFVLLFSVQENDHDSQGRLFRLNLEPLHLLFDPIQSKLPCRRDELRFRISNDGNWVMGLGLADHPNSVPLWRARIDLTNASIGEPEIMIDDLENWNIHLYRILNNGDALFYTMGIGQEVGAKKDSWGNVLRYWRPSSDFWETIELPESISHYTDLHFIEGDSGSVVYGQIRSKTKQTHRVYSFDDGKLTATHDVSLACSEKLPIFPNRQDCFMLLDGLNAPRMLAGCASIHWNSDGRFVSLASDYRALRWKISVESRKSTLLRRVADFIAKTEPPLGIESLPEELVSLIAKLRISK
jgi:hypothetical protein